MQTPRQEERLGFGCPDGLIYREVISSLSLVRPGDATFIPTDFQPATILTANYNNREMC